VARVAPYAINALIVVTLITGYALWTQMGDAVVEPAAAVVALSPANSARAPRPPRIAPPAAVDEIPFMEPQRAGGVAYASAQYEDALDLYREAVQRHPADAESWSNLGQVLVRLNRSEEAIAAFQRAIALNHDRWAYHFNLGRALGLLNRWEESVQAYERAQRLFPDDYAIAFNLGLALRKKGDHEAAVEQFAKAITLDPQDPTFHLAMAMSYDKLGRKEAAVAAYRKTVDLAPEAPEAPQIRARINALLN
jgi:tetratricopeptide (TPR) repeat protein